MNGLNPPQPPQQPPQQAPNQHHTQQTHQHHGPITDTFSVPDQLVGLIIGKNGEVSSDFCYFFFKLKIIVETLRFPNKNPIFFLLEAIQNLLKKFKPFFLAN